MEGYYQGRKKWAYVKYQGDRASYHEAGRDVFHAMRVELGEFGPAPQNIREKSGKLNYNMKLVIYWDNDVLSENMFEKFRVISDDRQKVFFLNDADKSVVEVSERITKEMAEEVERSGLEPISAPPGPYTIQPDNQGRLVFLTGPPGAGKSTTAQLLGRLHGFVYYEVDCFVNLRNPFIPLDVENPTMMQDDQRTLGGEGIEERKKVCQKAEGLWGKLIRHDELSQEDWELMEKCYYLLCEDILSQRRRIGGDWAMAGCVPFRRVRDVLRANLGPELVIVNLTLDTEEVRERISSRNPEPSISDALMNIAELCMNVEENEENVINVRVDKNMAREDVVNQILSKL